MLDLLGIRNIYVCIYNYIYRYIMCQTTIDNFTVMSTAAKYLDLLTLLKLIWEFISNYLPKHVNIEIKTILQ